MSVLRFDLAAVGAPLRATHEWALTADLPSVGANAGLEAITWIPDTALLAAAFQDERTGRAYAPADYPDHGSGLFVVGLEATGQLYLYALNHADSTALRVASVSSGQPRVMGLEYDRETGYLWAHCDDTCANHTTVLTLDAATGQLTLRVEFLRPSTLVNSNHEGIALAPEAECVGGYKPFFWVDDADNGGHSVRVGDVRCGAFLR